MVNLYVSPETAERSSPYYSPQAPTAAEAAFRAGQQVAFRGSYAPMEAYGNSPEHAAIVQQEQNQQQQAQQAQSSRGNPYLNRPDIVAQRDLGDKTTQQLIQNGYTVEQALEKQRQEATNSRERSYYENELSKAMQTNISTASGYHAWARDTGVPQAINPYEYVADLSLMTLKGTTGKNAYITPINPNSLGLVGGAGVQDNAWLNARSPGSVNPDYTQAVNVIAESKRTSAQGAYGNLQSYSSGLGVITVPEQQAIARQASMGAGWTTRPDLQQYNPAAYLGEFGYGGRGRVLQARSTVPHDTPSQKQPMMLPAPFVSKVVGDTQINPNGGGGMISPLDIRADAAGQDGIAGGMQIDWAAKKPFKSTIAVKDQGLPAGVYPTGDIGVSKSGNARFMGATSTIDKPGPTQVALNLAIMGENYARTRNLGILYEDFRDTAAATTTHILPDASKVAPQDIGTAGRFALAATNPTLIPSLVASGKEGANGATFIGAAAKEAYQSTRNDPIQDVALFALPGAFKVGEGLVSEGVAKAAMSKNVVSGTVGRGLSTPAAITAGSAIKGAIGAAYIIESGVNFMNAPNTPEGKGKAAGVTLYQVGMMGLGTLPASDIVPKPTNNIYESRTFFSGERRTPLSERVMIRAGDFVNGLSQSPAQRVAIRDVSTEYMSKSASFTKPDITTREPNLADLTHVGKQNAPAIEQAMTEEPAVFYGSGTIRAQTDATTPMGKTLIEKAGTSHDVDMFTTRPEVTEARIRELGGDSAVLGTDVHAFPSGYPNVGQEFNSPQQPGSYLFGNRYRTNPYPDEITRAGITPKYEGMIDFEHMNVQNRKLTSAIRDDVADPMNKGYRLGKDLSRGTRTRDYLAEIQQNRNIKLESNAHDRMLKQTITYNEQSAKTGEPNIRTDTLFNIRDRYERGLTGEPGEAILQRPSKGAISSSVSAVSPGIIAIKPLSPSKGSSPSMGISPIRTSTKSGAGGRSSGSSGSKSPSTKSSKSGSSAAPSLISSGIGSSGRSTGGSSTPSIPRSGMPSLIPSGSPSKSPGSSTGSPPSISPPSISPPSRSPPSTSPPSSPPPSPPYTPRTGSPGSPVPPITPIMAGTGGSGSMVFGNQKAYFGFKEKAKVWTPEQQGRALLTGSYGKKKSPVKMPKAISSGIKMTKSKSRRKR